MSRDRVKVKRHAWVADEKLSFHPGEEPQIKPTRRGVFVRLVEKGKIPPLNIVEVRLDGDPFSVCVHEKQIQPTGSTTSPQETEGDSNMPTATKTQPSAKELRRQAKTLEIEGWEEMTLGALRKAVEKAETANGAAKPARTSRTAKATPAKKAAAPVEDDVEEDEEDEVEEDEVEETPAPRARKSAAKKAPAKAATKTAAKKAAATAEEDEPAENGNPYRPGTNIHLITDALIAGGKRSDMVKKLKRKIKLNPRDDRELDVDAELDRRILIVGQNLAKDHGFNVVRDGRGKDATIVAEPPE